MGELLLFFVGFLKKSKGRIVVGFKGWVFASLLCWVDGF
jgi:hypothetical protein